MKMPPSQTLGSIGLFLLGVWALLQAISQLAFYLPIVFRGEPQLFGWEQLLGPAVFCTIGIGLVLLNRTLAGALFTCESDAVIEGSQDLEQFLLALLGVWVVIDGMASAAQVETSLLAAFASEAQFDLGGDKLSYLTSPEAWSSRAPYLVRLFLGVLVVLYSRGLVNSWRRLRSVGWYRP